jgi:hypothetical protein
VDGASFGKHPPPAVFLHAVPNRVEMNRAELSRSEPNRAEARWLLLSSKQLSIALPTTPVNTETRQQGSEPFSRCPTEGI